VVEISSTGAEILFLMDPEFLVVRLLFGIGVEISAGLTARFVVNALERLDIVLNVLDGI
jgi:hypothetical protein